MIRPGAAVPALAVAVAFAPAAGPVEKGAELAERGRLRFDGGKYVEALGAAHGLHARSTYPFSRRPCRVDAGRVQARRRGLEPARDRSARGRAGNAAVAMVGLLGGAVAAAFVDFGPGPGNAGFAAALRF